MDRLRNACAILVCASHALLVGAAEPSLPYDLREVRGIEIFPQDPGLRSLLSRNGFAVVPRSHPQVFCPYLARYRPESPESRVPPFVTVDSAVRTYQVLLEAGLSFLEKAQADRIRALCERVFRGLPALEVEGAPWVEARARLLAWAGVGLALLEGSEDLEGLPEPSRRLLREELAKIRRGEPAPSAIFPRDRDAPGNVFFYGHLAPAGIYAREPRLARYWKAIRWFGLTSFRVRSEEESRSALLLAALARRDPGLLETLRQFAEPLDRLLGPSEDIGLAEAAEILRREADGAEIEDPSLENLPEARSLEKLLPRFRRALAALPLPRVNDQALPLATFVLEAPEATQGVRLIPPRYTWEAELLTRLGRLQLPTRALSVAAALGDPSALSLASREDEARGPSAAAGALAVGVASIEGRAILERAPASVFLDATRALGELFRPLPDGVPAFAKTDSWKAFTTWTWLASWTCLRHAHELHAKEDIMVFGLPSDLLPSGYVAPYPELFAKLGDAARAAASILERSGAFAGRGEGIEEVPESEFAESGLLVPNRTAIKEGLCDFARLMDDIARISRKQIAGEALDISERELLENYGERLGALHLYPANAYLSPRDDMPCVSLLATETYEDGHHSERYLGVGRALEVFAIRYAPEERLPPEPGETAERVIPPGLQLYRGATLDFYEFERPALGARLDDERWREILDSGDRPLHPVWALDFLLPIRASTLERIRAGEWVPEAEELYGPEIKEAALEGYREALRTAGLFRRPLLQLYLANVDPEETQGLLDLAREVPEEDLCPLSGAFFEKAPEDASDAVLEAAVSGDERLLLVAVARSGDLPEMRSALGEDFSRWARAFLLGWMVLPLRKTREEWIEVLIRLARADPSFLVRAQALDSLSSAPREQAVPVLREAARTESSPAARLVASMGLLAQRDFASLPSIARALWSFADPSEGDRRAVEAEALDPIADRMHVLFGRFWGEGEWSFALTLHDRVAEVSPGILAEFDAAMLAREPSSESWNWRLERVDRDLWRTMVVGIASDPERPADDRTAILRGAANAVWDEELACALEPLLDEAGVTDRGGRRLAEAAAEAILSLLPERFAPKERLEGASLPNVARAALASWRKAHEESRSPDQP